MFLESYLSFMTFFSFLTLCCVSTNYFECFFFVKLMVFDVFLGKLIIPEILVAFIVSLIELFGICLKFMEASTFDQERRQAIPTSNPLDPMDDMEEQK